MVKNLATSAADAVRRHRFNPWVGTVCVCVCVYSIYVCLVYTHKTNSLLALTSTVVLTSREGKLREENEEFSRLNKAI